MLLSFSLLLDNLFGSLVNLMSLGFKLGKNPVLTSCGSVISQRGKTTSTSLDVYVIKSVKITPSSDF